MIASLFLVAALGQCPGGVCPLPTAMSYAAYPQAAPMYQVAPAYSGYYAAPAPTSTWAAYPVARVRVRARPFAARARVFPTYVAPVRVVSVAPAPVAVGPVVLAADPDVACVPAATYPAATYAPALAYSVPLGYSSPGTVPTPTPAGCPCRCGCPDCICPLAGRSIVRPSSQSAPATSRARRAAPTAVAARAPTARAGPWAIDALVVEAGPDAMAWTLP